MGLSVVCFVVASCVSRDAATIDYALSQAGDNRGEIEAVLSHYGDDERGEIAEWLVKAMIGYMSKTGAGLDSIERMYEEGEGWFYGDDLKKAEAFADMPQTRSMDLATVKAGYLISNIDEAYALWKQHPWRIGREEFCEMLLPYRIGDEKLSDWRGPYREWLRALKDSVDGAQNTVEAARIVAGYIGWVTYNDQLTTPHRSAIRLLECPIGTCRDDCDRVVYAMRSLGVPVAVDMMLVSPDFSGTPHMWNVVYDDVDGTYRMFDTDKYVPSRDTVYYDRRRKGKVYRPTFAVNKATVEKYRNVANPPSYLANPHIKDVTAEYFGANEAVVEIDSDAEGDVYLGLFARGGFVPADLGANKGGKAVFRDIEPEVIYFPIAGDGGRYKPCGMPFMLMDNGEVHRFVPDEAALSRASLARKYPMNYHQTDRLASIKGMRVQVAESGSGPWRDVHAVNEAAKHNYYKVPLAAGGVQARYIRLYQAGEGSAGLAELVASDDSLGLHPRRLEIYGDTDVKKEFANLADGDILTTKWLAPGDGRLIFRNCDGRKIEHLFIVPHNDDNYVVPAQEYELLYYTADGWKSLGRKMSEGFSIDYDVPANAVMLLRNHTKGREEQVFVYRDGRQMYNLDLRGTT